MCLPSLCGEIGPLDTVRHILVDSTTRLKEASQALAGAERFFIDTEFETMGQARGLCLIQVSCGAEVYLVDARKLSALESLAAAIGRPDSEWVLHAGRQDVAWLREALKLEAVPRLFDTQVAWGLLGPEYPVSLAYLLYRILGVRDAKEQQAGDWARRPLSDEQLEYAAKDVSCLPALREWMIARLEPLGRSALVHPVSVETVTAEPPKPLSLDDYRNAWQLDASGQAALRFLIDWHNGLPPAEKAEAPYPPVLLTLARMLPESGAELAKVKGVPFAWVKKNGDSFTGKLMRASASATAEGFVSMEPPPYNTVGRILAGGRVRKAVADVCAGLGLAPELVCPERVVKELTLALTEKGTGEAAAAALTGWREGLLRAAFLEKCGA